MTRLVFAVTTMVLVGAAFVFAQDAGRAEISGSVVGDDAALPGVRVSAIGAGTERSVISDAYGRFTLPSLSPGTYRISAELPGFQTVTRAVSITAPGVLHLDFVLEVGCLSEVLYVDPGWAWALEHADAVVHLRISETIGPRRWKLDQSCLVGTEHVATVGDVLKLMDPDSRPSTIRLLEPGPSPSYAAGDEYIALLTWHPNIGKFQPLAGPLFMFPVRDGRVAWTRRDVPGLTDGMSVDAFLGVLRSSDPLGPGLDQSPGRIDIRPLGKQLVGSGGRVSSRTAQCDARRFTVDELRLRSVRRVRRRRCSSREDCRHRRSPTVRAR